MLRKTLKVLTSRKVITGVLILVQIAWLVILFWGLLENNAWLGTVSGLLSVLIILFIVNKSDSPAYKIGWILFIMVLPLFGGPAYLIFGNKRPARKLRRSLEQEHNRSLPTLVQDEEVLGKLSDLSPRMAGTARFVTHVGQSPVHGDTDARYYPLGDDMFPDMLKDMEAAERFIFLEYFILEEGEMWSAMLRILTEKAEQGVDVRLLYDDVGSVSLLPIDFPARMEALKIKCMSFNRFVPLISLVMNNRNHRKILVVDGVVGYTGGINLADEYINRVNRFGHWKDSGVRLMGDGVWNLTQLFLEMWNALKPEVVDPDLSAYMPRRIRRDPAPGEGFVQAFGSSPLEDVSLAENLYIDLLGQACRSAYICTPYLLIDSELQTALCSAARRGVKVCLFTPGIPDKKIVYQMSRSYYPPLLQAGVQIYEYSPGFLHAKSIVVDESVALVGTINLDYRSLYLHFECGALLYNTPCIRDLWADMLALVEQCRRVSLEDCRRGLLGGLADAVLRLFAPLV
jgi:cardiolipin synthase